ncbi:hypothetical protein DFH06DRAFT_1135711 [Mycena polygramma]|nr:hypothetical protein DFH06DRAFT_1135711 [Mycena polygramma]
MKRDADVHEEGAARDCNPERVDSSYYDRQTRDAGSGNKACHQLESFERTSGEYSVALPPDSESAVEWPEDKARGSFLHGILDDFVSFDPRTNPIGRLNGAQGGQSEIVPRARAIKLREFRDREGDNAEIHEVISIEKEPPESEHSDIGKTHSVKGNDENADSREEKPSPSESWRLRAAKRQLDEPVSAGTLNSSDVEEKDGVQWRCTDASTNIQSGSMGLAITLPPGQRDNRIKELLKSSGCNSRDDTVKTLQDYISGQRRLEALKDPASRAYLVKSKLVRPFNVLQPRPADSSSHSVLENKSSPLWNMNVSSATAALGLAYAVGVDSWCRG